jgi:PKHD-type hydroxylase
MGSNKVKGGGKGGSKTNGQGGGSMIFVAGAVVLIILAGAWTIFGESGEITPEGRFNYHMSNSTPNFATFKKLFTDEECDAIIKFGKRQPMADATISTGRTSDDDTRRGKIGRFAGEEVRWVYQRVLDAMHKANAHSWKYNLPTDLKSKQIETMQFGLYDHKKKAFYKFHADNGFIGSPHEKRKLSLTVQLSDNASYTGGELLIRPSCLQVPGKDLKEPETASSARGTAIVFPSCLSHMVTPVTRGTRYSLVQWVQTDGPAPKSDNMAMSYLQSARQLMDSFNEKLSKAGGKMDNALFGLLSGTNEKYKAIYEMWPSDMIKNEFVDTMKGAFKDTKGDARIGEWLEELTKSDSDEL